MINILRFYITKMIENKLCLIYIFNFVKTYNELLIHKTQNHVYIKINILN